MRRADTIRSIQKSGATLSHSMNQTAEKLKDSYCTRFDLRLP